MAAAHFSGYRERGPIHASTNRLSLCSLGGHRSSSSLFGLHRQGTTTIPHRRIPSPARCLSSAPCRNPVWRRVDKDNERGLYLHRRATSAAYPSALVSRCHSVTPLASPLGHLLLVNSHIN